MAVFRVERNSGYTVMSNHHLRNQELTLNAKGLLSQMLSLPEDWDYTLAGLSHINRESIDAIRTAVWELEKVGYILRRQGRDEKGKMTAIEYTIYEQPQPMLENPIPGKQKMIAEITDDEKAFDIPESWEWVKLGNVCTIARGGSPRPIKEYITTAGDGINWIIPRPLLCKR